MLTVANTSTNKLNGLKAITRPNKVYPSVETGAASD